MSRYFGYVYRNTNGQNHGPVLKTQLFFLNGICTVILWHGWEKVPNWECLFIHRTKDYSYLCGKKQNTSPTWKIRMKDIDSGEPASFFDHVCLGCTQRECQIRKDFVDNYRSMFESRISAVATDKLPETKSHRQNGIFVVL